MMLCVDCHPFSILYHSIDESYPSKDDKQESSPSHHHHSTTAPQNLTSSHLISSHHHHHQPAPRSRKYIYMESTRAPTQCREEAQTHSIETRRTRASQVCSAFVRSLVCSSLIFLCLLSPSLLLLLLWVHEKTRKKKTHDPPLGAPPP